MIRYFLLALSLCVINFSLNAQGESPKKKCGTIVPGPEWDAWFNSRVEHYKAEKAKGKQSDQAVVIPVVVHILHTGQAAGTFPNVSQAQVLSQIKILNDDFAGRGYNSQMLATTGFSAVGAANTGISFCLAEYDPDGFPLAEPGIHRVNINDNAWTNPNTFGSISNFQNYMDGTIKPATIWDPTYYLNIWICDVSANIYLLGYATFPGGAGLSGIPGSTGSGATDGVWVWTRCFGTGNPNLTPGYQRGRTLVHEIGHWLGLRHIGGDASNPAGDCNATDFCDDTPPQKGGFGGGSNGQNFGSPNYPIHVNACSSPFGDMFMNFMDYTEDNVLYMFTPDQNARMQTALQNGFFRNQLGLSSATLCAGLPHLQFRDQNTFCMSDSLVLLNLSSGLAGTSYTWSSEPAAGVVISGSAADGNPMIVFPGPGDYTLSVEAGNEVGFYSNKTVISVSECVGIKNRSHSPGDVTLYPNPGKDQVSVNFHEVFKGEATINYSVYNSLGQEVNSGNISRPGDITLLLDCSGLDNGIYFVSFTGRTEKVLKRLVIHH